MLGGPEFDDFEHFTNDRNKIAKNLKIMMRHIISLQKDPHHRIPLLKLFAIQT